MGSTSFEPLSEAIKRRYSYDRIAPDLIRYKVVYSPMTEVPIYHRSWSSNLATACVLGPLGWIIRRRQELSDS